MTHEGNVSSVGVGHGDRTAGPDCEAHRAEARRARWASGGVGDGRPAAEDEQEGRDDGGQGAQPAHEGSFHWS